MKPEFATKQYIKVRDPKGCETGWAYIQDGDVILDNAFERIKPYSLLVLADDNYTIIDVKSGYSEQLQAQLDEELRKERQAKQAELKHLLGCRVISKESLGTVCDLDNSLNRAYIEFDNGVIKRWNLETIKGHIYDWFRAKN